MKLCGAASDDLTIFLILDEVTEPTERRSR